jgi:hypothetical protein
VSSDRPIAAIALTLLVAAGFACQRGRSGGTAPAGAVPASEPVRGATEEIFAIAPYIVTEVEYRAGARQVIARRAGSSNEAFSITVATGTAPVERCRARADFDEILGELASIRARPLTASERQAVGSPSNRDGARLRILDATAIGPQEFGVVLDTRFDGAVLFDGDRVYASTVPKATFERLSGGCAALGVPAGTAP